MLKGVFVLALVGVAHGTLTMQGADMSSVEQAQTLGAKFYTSAGVAADPYQVIANANANWVRLRVWNNPKSGQCNTAQVLSAAKKAKAIGHKLLIDFHYSDTWADPGVQTPPSAWASHSMATLKKDVYDFTYSVCSQLKSAGTTPDAVQIGNEINVGMLWSVGKVVSNSFGPLADLLKQGYSAAKACSSSIQVMIHTANADSGANARWFYDGIKAQGVTWDLTGLSYYCYYHGTLANMQSVVADMKSRYSKPVVIVETSYPFTTSNADSAANVIGTSTPCSGYSATQAGQAALFTAVQQAAENGGAIGVFYWEPAWVAVKGNGWNPADTSSGASWDNQAVFDFNHKWNPSFTWLHKLSSTPASTPKPAASTPKPAASTPKPAASTPKPSTPSTTPKPPTPATTSAPTSVTASVSAGTYTIKSKYSGKLLDVSGASAADGANVDVWSSNGCQCQKWTISAADSGYYKVINVNSGKALDVAGMGTANGANIDQWTYNDGWNQHWEIKSVNGYHAFVSRLSGKAVDLWDWNTADGANVALYDYWAGDSQLWTLATVSTAASSGATPSSSCSSTVALWGSCLATPSCCSSGNHCYGMNQYYAQCRPSCVLSELAQYGWTCTYLG